MDSRPISPALVIVEEEPGRVLHYAARVLWQLENAFANWMSDRPHEREKEIGFLEGGPLTFDRYAVVQPGPLPL